MSSVPLWLFPNLPDKILFLVRAAHSGKVATWWRREVLQSESVFHKQFLLRCRVIKLLQCLLGSCDDWIDPSLFYYPLERSEQLVCISQHHWILVRKGAFSVPFAAVGAAGRCCPGPGPSHTKYSECLAAQERVVWGSFGWCQGSCAVSLHLGTWSICSSVFVISVIRLLCSLLW